MPVKLLDHVLAGKQIPKIPYTEAFDESRLFDGCFDMPYRYVFHVGSIASFVGV